MKRILVSILMVAALLFSFCDSGAGALTRNDKLVVVDKTHQMLRAYERGQLVFASRVSTGRRGKETPNGVFRVRSKSLMHYSTRYDNAPMPYSVQIAGNYFIHGFSYVPDYPASHGCIRLPLDAAPWFYHWAAPGTPVAVTGRW